MENTGSGTTMSPGVVTSVPRAAESGSGTTNAAPAKETRAPEIKPEVHDQVIKGETVEEKGNNNIINFADYLAEKAKRDGVDAALVELAKDAQEKDHQSFDEARDKVTDSGKENKFEEQEDVEKPDPVRAEVEGLKMRVQELSEENAELKARVSRIEQVNNIAAVNAYELALLLKKLIEEAESDKQKKENLLAMLATLIAMLLKMILVDDPEDENQKGSEKLAA